MIMPRSSDVLLHGRCANSGLTFLFADLIETARTLASRHRCGPVAAGVLAETLAGAALLSGPLQDPRACLRLHLNVEGPVRAVRVECTAAGALRGAPWIKCLDELEALGSVDDIHEALGREGEVMVVESSDDAIVQRHDFTIRPAALDLAVRLSFKRLYNCRTLVALAVFRDDVDFDVVRAFAVLAPLDARPAAFRTWVRAARDGRLREILEHAGSLETVCELVGGTALQQAAPRRLHFACNCSTARIQTPSVTGTGSSAWPDGLPEQRVFCPMCGLEYRFPPRDAVECAAPPGPDEGVQS